MNESDRIEMMRALADEMSVEERKAFERVLADDSVLRAEWASLQRVEDLLHKNRAESFRRFFAARVARRIEGAGEERLADALMWLFRPLAPLALVLAVFLALSNWNERELVGEDASFLETVFVAVPATAEAAYVMDM